MIAKVVIVLFALTTHGSILGHTAALLLRFHCFASCRLGFCSGVDVSELNKRMTVLKRLLLSRYLFVRDQNSINGRAGLATSCDMNLAGAEASERLTKRHRYAGAEGFTSCSDIHVCLHVRANGKESLVSARCLGSVAIYELQKKLNRCITPTCKV